MDKSWLEKARRVRRLGVPAGLPSTVMEPAVIFCTPIMERMSVVFPHPEGPMSPVISPRFHRARACN